MTKLIDGKKFAENLRADIARRVALLKAEKNLTPGLAVIRVGDDPASEVYVRNKAKQTVEAGMNSYEHILPQATSEAELLSLIRQLNDDAKVHGILVQLPLPVQINKDKVLNAIAPHKDVDGFHPVNVAKLERGEDGFVPCTPLGCLMLLHDYFSTSPSRGEVDALASGGGDSSSYIDTPTLTLPPQGGGNLLGKKAVVMGRSNIVGKPMAELLRKEGCIVSVIHSQTSASDRAAWLKNADIVVVAVGKPKMLHGREIKAGAVVIDVGINRITQPDGKTKLVGDVDFDSCQGIASAITPVPGGVGPMTIACLLENSYSAALSAAR